MVSAGKAGRAAQGSPGKAGRAAQVSASKAGRAAQGSAAGWIVGNLDCERSWAQGTASAIRAQGGAGRIDTTGRPEALSPRALRRIAALATLLRVFARGPRDAVWTPAPVDPARVTDVPGLPRPRFVSGKLGSAAAGDGPMLAWGETGNVAAWRGRQVSASPDTIGGTAEILGEWDWPIPSAEAAARVNHRAFGLTVAQALGCALVGSRMIGSIGELAAHLAAGGADASPDAAWVLKAPWSAAGRGRVFGHGGEIADEAVKRRVEGLLERQDALLFEPWMRRVADFGASGVVGPSGLRLIGMHRLVVDRHGGFRGIDVARTAVPLEGRRVGLKEAEQRALEVTLADVGRALAAAGYHGPFGVDAWRHEDRDGRPAFQALGEINARMTFGLVARALAERVGPAVGWPDDAVIRLRLGKGEPGARGHHQRGRGDPAILDVMPLLRPGGEDSTCAWLELSRDPIDTE